MLLTGQVKEWTHGFSAWQFLMNMIQAVLVELRGWVGEADWNGLRKGEEES